MASITRTEWAPEFIEHSARRAGDPYRWSRDTLTFHSERPLAQLQPGDRKQEQGKDDRRDLYKPPSSGRTTALGRRVEKPAPERQGGPSGQTDQAKHNIRHANK